MQQLTRSNIEDEQGRKVKVLQFGGGHFMRAYLDWMINRMNNRCDYQGAVVIVKPTKVGSYDRLIEQQGLYHVITNGYTRGEVVDEVELITCVERIIHPYQQFAEFMNLTSEPDLRVIVSNTTESGIVYQPSGYDAIPPESFPAKLCLWLKARFDFFKGDPTKGCIILPCELIENNGQVLKDILIKHAQDWRLESKFADWLQQANVFCNTLVDRIVPGKLSVENQTKYQEITGYWDDQMVVAEPYHLLVIEGPPSIENEFPLKRAGIHAIITDDLSGYRLQKVRLLNGGHTSMVPLGLLMGIETVGAFMRDPGLSSFLDKLMRLEIIPSLNTIDPAQLNTYVDQVFDRFRNPFVQHQLSSIALNSLAKFMVRILPSIEGYQMTKGLIPERLLLAFVALIRFYQGTWKEEKLPVNDAPDLVQRIQQLWTELISGKMDPEQFASNLLADQRIWQRDLTEIPSLKSAFVKALKLIQEGRLMEEVKRLS